jgi:hypothetical protein
LAFLDSLEEFRDLALEEWNFRKLVQENLEKLPEQQREHWRQRGKIKWATLGDENTNFFHSTATITHNENSIMMLKDINGVEKFRHEEKAEIIWEAYKERLGTCEFTQMHFDLNGLMEPMPDLHLLHDPFTAKEIDSIINNLPTGKSPELDDFNSDFMKNVGK